jgi:hypothetical protein
MGVVRVPFLGELVSYCLVVTLLSQLLGSMSGNGAPGSVIASGERTAPLSPYNLSFNQSASSTVGPDVALTRLVTNYSGGPNITVSFSVAGTLELTNSSFEYYVFFDDPTLNTSNFFIYPFETSPAGPEGVAQFSSATALQLNGTYHIVNETLTTPCIPPISCGSFEVYNWTNQTPGHLIPGGSAAIVYSLSAGNSTLTFSTNVTQGGGGLGGAPATISPVNFTAIAYATYTSSPYALGNVSQSSEIGSNISQPPQATDTVQNDRALWENLAVSAGILTSVVALTIIMVRRRRRGPPPTVDDFR